MSAIENLKKSLCQVEAMPYSDLCDKFHNLYGNIACPTNSRTLKNRIIYKLQEIFYGGISKDDMRILDEIKKNQQSDHTNLCPGSSLGKTAQIHYVREWKGSKYDVTEISEKCYEYDGKQYRSLTAVAKAITGTHWNGKAFFGVKK